MIQRPIRDSITKTASLVLSLTLIAGPSYSQVLDARAISKWKNSIKGLSPDEQNQSCLELFARPGVQIDPNVLSKVPCAGTIIQAAPTRALHSLNINSNAFSGALNNLEVVPASSKALNWAFDLQQQAGGSQDPAKPQQQAPPTSDQKPGQETTEQAPEDNPAPDDGELTDPDCVNKKTNDNNDPCASGERGKKGGHTMHSVKWEIGQGMQTAAQIDRSEKFIDDPGINEWVNRMTRNIYQVSDCGFYHYPPLTVKIIDTNEINAFALPSGILYVNAGLLEAADEEGEVAGVFGHEIAHVCRRHIAKMADKGTFTEIGYIGAMIFCPVCVYPLYYGSQIMIPAMFLKFSRALEADADKWGAQYTRKAGYDPQDLFEFFKKIESKKEKKGDKGSVMAQIFRNHPPTPERMKSIQSEISKWPPPEVGYLKADTLSKGGDADVETGEPRPLTFQESKARLIAIRAEKARQQTLQKAQDEDPTKKDQPTLKKKKPKTDDVDANPPVIKNHPTDQ